MILISKFLNNKRPYVKKFNNHILIIKRKNGIIINNKTG